LRVSIALLALLASAGCAQNLCDLDGDGDKKWDDGDFAVFDAAYFSNKGEPNYNKAADANSDGTVNGQDFAKFVEECGGEK
jgi:hypothetical protein